MGKSFRLRLALSSAALAGVALAGFAAIAWWQMHDAKIGALDREIRDQADRELSRPRPAEHWTHQEQVMGNAFDVSTPQQTLLLVQYGDSVVFKSAHWPQDLNAQALPWPPPQSDNGGYGQPGHPDRGAYPNSDWPPREDIPDDFPPPRNRPPRSRPGFTSVSLNTLDGHWRFGLASLPYGRKLAIGVNLAVVETAMVDLRNAFLLAMPLALGFIGLGAWYLSGRALAPISRLTATMMGITAQGLDRRLAVGQEDREFSQLILVFNGMLERLERSFLQTSRFSADAAHELKTPLAIMQGQIERAMGRCEAGSPIQTSLADILDEVQRLSAISSKLLLLSLADAGRLRLHKTPFDLSGALEELLEDAQMLAPSLVVSGAISPNLGIEADAELLRQVLHNLLSNAIKYNIPHGWIRITTRRQAGRIEVSVANASLGIAMADRERIFERFYRTDPAHSRQIEGVGLGLSLSREIVRAHGGDLQLVGPANDVVQFVVSFGLGGLPKK